MMFKRLALLVLLTFAASTSLAKDFTNADFLKLTEGQQHWWYAGATESIGHLVYLHDEKKAKCVWEWLPSDPEGKKDLLKRSFEMYPAELPTTVLLALLQRSCGKLMEE